MDVKNLVIVILVIISLQAWPVQHKNFVTLKSIPKKLLKKKPISYDLPITYNKKVSKWVNYYQKYGKNWFSKWLTRSNRYKFVMQTMLKKRGLPQDLFYLAMIESGFSPFAKSTASAVGYWQFIKATADRYGLSVKWWIDERRDFIRSTTAAINYLDDLYDLFGDWYLAASAYNMGENRLKRLIKKHKSNNFWVLSSKDDFPKETREYIPKLIAAMLIAKNPKIYGFHKLEPHQPLDYEYFHVPGGTDLITLAGFLKVPSKKMKKLNPSLIKGYIPQFVKSFPIRIPKGSSSQVTKYIRGI